MMRLILKELKQLLPFTLLWLCLVALFYGAELATVRIDEESYVSWCKAYCDVGTNIDLVLFTILFYMIAAYSLFPKEFDESTVDFLRSLPIGRKKIFFSKVIAAWLLLFLLLILDRVLQGVVLSFNTQSITGKNYWMNDFRFFTRDSLFAFVVVSHGVFLSWFRTTGLIIYCVYLIGLILLEQIAGVSGIYNIFSFFDNEYDGQKLLVDWQVIGFHLVIAFLLLMLSYFMWTGTDSRPKTPGTGAFARAMPVVLSFLGFVVVAGWMVAILQSASVESEQSDIQRLNTDHYSFSYRSANERAMLMLEPFVEDDYAALVELLGAADIPLIQADMTSDSEHALGLATWKKIRMVLKSEDEVDPLYRRVLSHETAHVFQSVESNRALTKSANSVGFFIEGMAQYTSFAIVPDLVSRESNWLISSVAWQRQDIKFDALANRSAFESQYDPELLYGIGDIWVDAMARTCGKASIGDFLRASGRDNAPPNIGGVGYWRNHLQHIGCELELVNNEWRQMMQRLIDERAVGAFPHFENVVVSRASAEGLINIKASLRPGELGVLPEYYYIRVKSETKLANSVSPVLRGALIRDGADASVEFSILPRLIDGKRFRYQLGFTPLPDSRHYFDQWRSGALPQ